MRPPKASPSAPRKSPSRIRRWIAAWGVNSLLISILLHLLFAAGATYLIIEHFNKKKHVNFYATAAPAQNTEVEHKVELAKRNNVESAPPDIKRITTTDVSSITLPDVPETATPDVANPANMGGVGEGLEMGDGTGFGNAGGVSIGGPPPPPFGVSDGLGLKGYLFDLKLAPDGKPPPKPPKGKGMIILDNGKMDVKKYYETLSPYFYAGLNDSLLDKFYKGDKPLYSTRFAISNRPSGEAPKAFNLESIVKPGLWVIHYHGRVQAPSAGDYRFIGWGDNVLAVKINGTVVLDGGWNPLSSDDSLHQVLPSFTFSGYNPDADKVYKHDPHLKIGTVFHLDADDTGTASEPVDMDVLIGDDGGKCGFFLLVEKEGNKYATAPDGTPEYPFFQLDTKSPPAFPGEKGIPPYSKKPEPWRVVTKDADGLTE
ncbi:MAG TPA: hypothetical protein VL981_06990 [Candidatus Methylacidiphilales bacterium]|nr:hypothetical protein [Candidatus Methylacidiphilales bacterium]